MPYTGDPANSATDRVRLIVGDTDVNNEALTDSIYQYLIGLYPTEFRAAIEALRMIKADLAKFAVRERVGQEEIFGQQAYENYCKQLEMLEKELALNLGGSGVYAGGISLADFCDNKANTDNVRPPVEKGVLTTLTGDVCNNNPENPSRSTFTDEEED